ncbi:hypothetical protein KR044_012177, partial [Drosophila immigrans]
CFNSELAFIMKGCIVGMWLLTAVIALNMIANSECADYRLSSYVRPSFYNLTINIEDDATNPGTSFNGEVAITLKSNQRNLLEIVLHKRSLNISSCSLFNKAGLLQQNIATTLLQYDNETDLLTVPLSHPMTANENYTLHFKYSGKVRDDMSGLFSEYFAHFGTASGIVPKVFATQLESTDARLVFPCFDEPTFKAKFQLHIGRPSNYNAISNTRLIRTTNEGKNRFMDHFDVTPIMSTYLVAFVVANYQARGNISEFAVLSWPEYYNNTEFSYNVGKDVIAAYNELFSIPYQQLGNEVLLFASVPLFDIDGMENWGLIIYSEEVLVQKPGFTDGFMNKEYTCRMIAHEMAHMWFGNSVTLSWWSHLWLNEGFARFYEVFMTNQLYPEFNSDETFVVVHLHPILEDDSLAISHPLTRPESSVQTLSESEEVFSNFAYEKGSSIIRMWRNLMGGDNFDKSINSYLKQYHLKNAQPRDLFAHLKRNWPAQPEVNLVTFFSDFTEQVGYPMVTVNITEDKQRIILNQTRFLTNPKDGSDPTLRYTIPITFSTNLQFNFNNLSPHAYFYKNNTTFVISFEEPIDWIIVNLKQSNYYRVFYDKPILTQIKLALSKDGHSSVPVENRAQIIDDLFNFASAGMIDYAEVFEFLDYLRHELDFIPWFATYHGLERVAKRLTPQQLPHFEKYLTTITTAVFSKLTVKSSSNDTAMDVYNRQLQVSWLCKYQNADCNNQVKLHFEGNLEKPSADYRENFYCAAARTTDYARMLDLYTRESDSDKKSMLQRALSCTRDYVTHYNNMVLSSKMVEFKTDGVTRMYQQNPDLITPIFSMLTE